MRAAQLEVPESFTGIMPLDTTTNGAYLYERTETPVVGEPSPHDRARRSGRREDYTARADETGRLTSVTESSAWRVVGCSATGKQYTRWMPISLTTVRVLTSGRHTVFRRAWTQAGQRQLGFPYYDGDLSISPGLRRLAAELLGPAPNFGARHPLLAPTARYVVRHRAFLARYWDAADVPSLTLSLFGRSRRGSDLVQAVAEADVLSLFVAWSMRGLVPTEWLVELLHRSTANQAARHDADWRWRPLVNQGDLRPHLRGLDRSVLRGLTRCVHGLTRDCVWDLSNLPAAPPTRHRSWGELHDHTAAAEQQMR